MEKENKSVDFELLEHQEEAVEGVDEIYANQNRFAGAKVPTGGGKSFIAMNEILKAGGNDYLSKTNDNPPINEAKIMYVAPTNEILFQFQCNIAEFILKKPVDGMEKDEIKAIVKKAFPNLSLKCYKTLISEMEKGKLSQQDFDLIILDEAHRSGAEKSQLAVAELLGCEIENGEPVFNPNSEKKSKVLAISATPERDVDGKNMMDLWAKALDNLTQEEIDNKEHLGMDLDLDTAVRKGIVVQPEVIPFNANLVDTPDYKRLVYLCENATEKDKERLEERLKNINEKVIGIPGYHKLSEEEQENAKIEKNLETIAQAVKDGKIEKGGKMIMFIPHNIKKDGVELEKTTFLKQKEEFIRKLLEKNGLKLEVSILSGDYTDDKNETTLNEFNKPVDGDIDLKIVIASDKLNEGVHVKGITNSFMERKIGEGENTTQRAQTILFLQQNGRTVFSIIPGKEIKKVPVILDFANNFYTQNRNNSRKDKIEIFQLTNQQAELLKAVRMTELELYDSSAPIQNRLPRLMDTLRIIKEYKFGPNNDIEFIPNNEVFKKNMTLEKLLDQKPLSEKKEEILKRLEEEYLYSPEKPNTYKIGKDFYAAKEAFWEGRKCLESYSLEEIIEYGIVDTNNDDLEKYENKYLVDLETGFIKMGIASKFIGLNIYTGTEFGLDGKDIEGFYLDQFDPETGKDIDGFYKSGFNDKGIHRDTGTIHDIHGFMADGINIQTGTQLDLDGYNIQGIRPISVISEIDGKKVEKIIGGWDRDGLWHLKNENGSFGRPISKYSEGYEPKQDVHGFTPGPRIRYVGIGGDGTSSVNLNDFYKDGICRRTGRYFDEDGYDIDGYDENGFNYEGIHRDTGTRFNLEGETVDLYSEKSKAIKNNLKQKLVQLKKFFGLNEDGKFHYKKNDGTEVIRKCNPKGFFGNGIHSVTKTYKDVFGFTMIDYYLKKERQDEMYGSNFKPYDVPQIVAGKPPYEIYKGQKNILGTDDSGMIDGKKHPSLEITSDYIIKCMKNGMSMDEFIVEFAKEHKLLVQEAKIEISKSFIQATTLYRICPNMQKSEESKEIAKIIYSASEEKVKQFLNLCPGLEINIRKDAEKYNEELERIEREQDELEKKEIALQEMEKNKRKLESLKKQKFAVTKRLEAIEKVPGLLKE